MSGAFFYFFFKAVLMNSKNNGCGSSGLDLSSGWNCEPKKNGWTLTGSSAISISLLFGDLAEKTKPDFLSRSIYSGLTSQRCLCRSKIFILP